MTIRKRKLPLVIINWRDHSGSSGDWIPPEELDDYEGGHEIVSVGWLLKNTRKEFIIIDTYDYSKRHFGGLLNVVKGPYTKMRKISGWDMTIEEELE